MQSWSEIADFYRAVSKRAEWTHLSPMLPLVEWLSGHSMVDGLFPFTSHEQLCLSSTSDRVAYLRMPFVTIVSTQEGEYLVTFSARPTSRVRMKRFIPQEHAHRDIPPLVSLLHRTAGDV